MEKNVSTTIVEGFCCKIKEALSIDAAIVGAGPSGLICAQRLAAKNRKVAIFESKLAPGGGIWGGAMLNNEIVVQSDCVELLDEFGVRYKDTGSGVLSVDSVEMASALIYRAVNAGTYIFNGVVVEDIVYKNGRVGGVVINWATVQMCNWIVDPLIVQSKNVLDATGHKALITEKFVKKTGIKLPTHSGEIEGEQPMWIERAEQATVDNTCEVHPGLFVSGMAANGVFGSPRMGPIFGGMLRSGIKAAELIEQNISQTIS